MIRESFPVWESFPEIEWLTLPDHGEVARIGHVRVPAAWDAAIGADGRHNQLRSRPRSWLSGDPLSETIGREGRSTKKLAARRAVERDDPPGGPLDQEAGCREIVGPRSWLSGDRWAEKLAARRAAELTDRPGGPPDREDDLPGGSLREMTRRGGPLGRDADQPGVPLGGAAGCREAVERADPASRPGKRADPASRPGKRADPPRGPVSELAAWRPG
jgi:hypothetical protein